MPPRLMAADAIVLHKFLLACHAVMILSFFDRQISDNPILEFLNAIDFNWKSAEAHDKYFPTFW